MSGISALFFDYTFQVVVFGSSILGLLSGVIGSFAVLRKQSLLGDAVSHAALPGICLAFILTSSKQMEILLLGALISGLLATWLITVIVKHSKVKFDSALALTTAVFFGFGLVLMTFIQKKPNSNQAGLESFIFGQSSTLLVRDVRIMFITGIILLLIVSIFWKEFKLLAFDQSFASSIGLPVYWMNSLLATLTVIVIVLGLQSVGVILMSSLLIGPAVAARQWTNHLSIMVGLAAFFGCLAGIIGTVISSLGQQIPTGPTIVLVISLIVLISILFSPHRGIVWKLIKNKQQKNHFATQLKKGR
ncbi:MULTISPECIES: metal ABC transporter permease [Carnobacterium]|uniref:Manganese import system permease protein ScaB n=1 Tax=Carnobacterium inhibens subsp. gilichinskyi TaxID=1266845 RepID=U5SB28_9LACT|nr:MULTISPECIES: metal ABC transporter permease [Carnobacterium]AGY81288.1 zinc ABC transporter permease [Carnobacterium inhibens subsp. gilichinskyi]MCM3512966.1 metal ABC transporter permease [Carnobacterium inhibens]MDN5371056.1 manganese/zinc/iron transport system permease protein [Carnobacterium sp.]